MVPSELARLPILPVGSPTVSPHEVGLPVSDPSSPYQLPRLPDDLPALPHSVTHSAGLSPIEDRSSEDSLSESHYVMLSDAPVPSALPVQSTVGNSTKNIRSIKDC